MLRFATPRNFFKASKCPICIATRAASSTTTRSSSIPPATIDLSDILNDPASVKLNLMQRKYPLSGEVVDDIRTMEIEAIGLRKEIQKARERRNLASAAPSSSSTSSSSSGATTSNGTKVKSEGAIVKALLKTLEPRLAFLNTSIQHLSLQLPNISHPWSPIGSEASVRVVKTLGPPIIEPLPAPNPLLDHLHLSSPSNLAWTDFPSASLITGSSWPLLTNEAALLELALTNYSMSIAIAHGFSPVLTPDVVRSEVAERCGFKPRDNDAQQTYFLSDGQSIDSNLCLAGTAEIPLVAMSAAKVFKFEELPLKSVALGRAFRAEAGARGADSRGLYRVHQFSKVEMVVVCVEEESDKILEELRGIQEEILGSLGLSLRVLDMPTEELGASANRKYDIEAWMPGRGKWGELSSASNCTDYQSRRLSIRYRPSTSTRPPFETLDIPTPAAIEATAMFPQLSAMKDGHKVVFAHTLNATAAAIPRLIVALLENGAVLEGEQVVRVRLPSVLRKFWIGKDGNEKIKWV